MIIKSIFWFDFVCFFFFSAVLKILVAAMENVDGEAAAAGPSTSAATTAEGGLESDEFYNTGRVGRRNALPDILSSHATISTADLPDQLGALTTSDKAAGAGPIPSTSSSANVEPTPSTSQITTTNDSWKCPSHNTFLRTCICTIRSTPNLI